jgi:hypothetical protein
LQTIEALASNTGIILLEYHTTDSFGTNETKDMYAGYSLFGTPSVVFNGASGNQALLGPKSYDVYLGRVNLLKEQLSTLAIEAVVTRTAPLSASVKLYNLDTDSLDGARVYGVVYQDLGTPENHYVVRDITPVQVFNLPSFKGASFDIESTEMDSPNTHLVIIVKSFSGLIVQSLLVK